jgi:hypothetical protein
MFADNNITIASFAAEQTENPPLGKGVDVRARSGYIVAPPSLHISGRAYAWNVDFHPKDVALAAAPEWLIERLKATRGGGVDSEPPEPHGDGFWSLLTQRKVTQYADMAAMRIAGHLLRHNIDPELARGLLHAWNGTCCAPPLTYREVNRVFNRVANLEGPCLFSRRLWLATRRR